jgi:hypothetical protein
MRSDKEGRMKKVDIDDTISFGQGERLRDFHLRKSIRTTVRSRRYGLKMEVCDPVGDLLKILGYNE